MDNTTDINMEIKETLKKGDELNISENVIASIVGLVTREIEGVELIPNGFFKGLIGKNNDAQGVKTLRSGSRLIIDIPLIITYGTKIPEVCQQIKSEVKKSVETMTGYNVLQINIYIEGLEC